MGVLHRTYTAQHLSTNLVNSKYQNAKKRISFPSTKDTTKSSCSSTSCSSPSCCSSSTCCSSSCSCGSSSSCCSSSSPSSTWADGSDGCHCWWCCCRLCCW